MRIPAVLILAFLLTGCTQGTPVGPDPDDFGSCPSWVRLPHNGQIISRGVIFLYSNATIGAPEMEDWDFAGPSRDDAGDPKRGTALGDGNLLEYDGHPLDFLRIDFATHGDILESKTFLGVRDAQATLRFIASDGGFPTDEVVPSYDVTKGKASAQDEWVFRSDRGNGYDAFNLTLQIDLADIEDEPAPRGVFAYWTWIFNLDGDQDTPSVVERGYIPEFWYRTCSKDGTRV